MEFLLKIRPLLGILSVILIISFILFWRYFYV